MTGRDWGRDDVILLGANHLAASVHNKLLVDVVVTTDKDFVAFMTRSPVTKLLPNPIEYFETLEEGRKRYDAIIAASVAR